MNLAWKFCIVFIAIILLPFHSYSQQFKWVEKSTCADQDYARYIETDNAGNTFIIGQFKGTLTFDGNIPLNKRTITSYGGIDIYLAKFNCNHEVLWLNQIGSTLNECGNYNYQSIKYDGLSNIYITGVYQGNCLFSSNVGASQSLTSAGNNDFFVARYDSSGVLLWTISSGGKGSDEGFDVNITKNKEVIVCGLFDSTSVFQSKNSNNISLVHTGSLDAFICKYDSLGNLYWVNKASSSGIDLASSIYIDAADNIYVSGNFACCGSGTATFGTHTIHNSNSFGAFLAKADPSGNWIWVNGMGSNANESSGRCYGDLEGNIYFNGHFRLGNSSISSLPPGSAIPLTNQGGYDVFVASFDSSGVIRWAKSLGSTYDDIGWNIYVTKQNKLYIAGQFATFSDMGNGQFLYSNGKSDGYFCELNKTNGNTMNCTTFGGTEDDYCYNIVSDNIGNIFLCGGFSDIAFFNNFTLSSAGAAETFLAKYNDVYTFDLVVSPKDTFCYGDSIKVYSKFKQKNVSYQWYKDGNPIAGANNDTLVVKNSGSYNLSCTDSCAESYTSNTINLYCKQIIVLTPDSIICFGDSVKLNAVGGISYLWTPSNSLSDSSKSNPIVYPLQSTKYIVTGKNGSCQNTDTVLINVIKVNVDAGPNQRICLHDTVQLNGTTNGKFIWKLTNVLVDTLNLNPVIVPIDTSVFILKSSIGKCSNADTVVINVIKVKVNAGNDLLVCFGDSIQINATSNASYYWSSGFGLRDTTILKTFVKPDSTSTYYLHGSIANCALTDTITIQVVKVFVNAGSDQTICYHDSIQLNAIANGNVTWFPNYGLSNDSILNPKASPTNSITYLLTAQIGICQNFDTVSINVIHVNIDAGIDTTLCLGDSIQLLCSTNTNFMWINGLGLSDSTILQPFVKPQITSTYILKGTTDKCIVIDSVTIKIINAIVDAGTNQNICFGDSIQLHGISNGKASWKSTNDLLDTTNLNPVVNPKDSSYFILNTTLGSCMNSDTVFINVIHPMADAGPDQIICIGDSVLLQGKSNGINAWNPSYSLSDTLSATPFAHPLSNTIYKLQVAKSVCIASDSVQVEVKEPLKVIAGADQQLCFGDSIQLIATNGFGYRWYPFIDMSDSLSETPIVTPKSSIDYFVKSSSNGCFSFDTMHLTVNPNPIITIKDLVVCVNQPTQINADVIGATTFIWTPNLGLSNDTIKEPFVQIYTPQQFKLKASNNVTGCFAIDSIQINTDSITVKFDFNPKSGVMPLEVTFKNLTTAASYYQWWFDSIEVDTSNEVNPIFLYKQFGNFVIRLIAISNLGCRDTAYHSIVVLPGQKLVIPNVFSPNGDNENDDFVLIVPDNEILKSVHGTIWNRWGDWIYEFTMPGGKWWDGNSKGVPCTEGVYFYVIEAIDYKGITTVHKGTVTLLR